GPLRGGAALRERTRERRSRVARRRPAATGASGCALARGPAAPLRWSAVDVIEGVLFDMDGLRTASEPLWQRAEIEIFGNVGLALTRAQCLQTRGLRVDEVVAHWFARASWRGPSQRERSDE